MKRQLLYDTNPLLRTKSLPVTAEHAGIIHELVADMLSVMQEAKGVGLAAVQVGVPIRVVIVKPQGEKPLVMVNPRILATSGSKAMLREACLSIPGRTGMVASRKRRVTVEAVSLMGATWSREFKGIDAVCVQHELDHLDGVLYTDRL